MGMDLRQVVAAVLTFSLFVMIGNMIKKDHFDAMEMQLPVTATVQHNTIKLTQQSLVKLPTTSKGPWKENGVALRPCWNKPSLIDRRVESKGSVVFSLTDGPEHHVSQIADAVVVCRYLGATLVLPDIRGRKPGQKRNFREIYDVNKFINSLDGIVKVAKNQPAEISNGKLTVVRVPHRVSDDYIAAKIEPIFIMKRTLRLETYFPTITLKKTEETRNTDSSSCLAMFGTLHFKSEVQEMVDLMVERLRILSWTSNGRFVAVDFHFEKSGKKDCRENGAIGKKGCYNAREIGEFLKKIGFSRDTTVYVTQSGWHNSLDALRDIYPKTYTKEAIIPEDKKTKFLDSASSDVEKVIDFHICSESDVFVPAFPSLFYANVAGKRIASGKTQILVPANVTTSASASDYLSPYISKKNHLAHSCFC